MSYALVVDGMIRQVMLKIPQQMRLKEGERLVLHNPPPVDELTQEAVAIEPISDEDLVVNFVVQSRAGALELARARKREAINASRDAANQTFFVFDGRQVAVDPLSQRDIDKVAMWVARFGAFPPYFPMAWKAKDNTYIPLPNTDAWDAFIGAMVMQGTVNFGRSQSLKAQLDAATTLEQISAVPNW